MAKDITERKGTVAYVLTAHRDELFNLFGTNRIQEARNLSIQLMDDPSITDKEAAVKAKQIFKTAKNNLFMSTLMTYMSGMKVS